MLSSARISTRPCMLAYRRMIHAYALLCARIRMPPVQHGGAAQVWFLQISRFGQAYVFAFCMLYSLGHARPFGMLHAHLLVHSYTIALGCNASACLKHHPFLQACALVQACFCCCTNERICMLQQCMLPAASAAGGQMVPPAGPQAALPDDGPAPQAEVICMPRGGTWVGHRLPPLS